MTDEQIITLVNEHFEASGVRDDSSFTEYYGKPDAFLKFARAMYKEGLEDGKWDEGWDIMIGNKR
jgi:hypothetical protein